MMFVYHYVIIPFNPQYLPKHAPLILQGAKEQGAVVSERPNFLYSYPTLIEENGKVKSNQQFAGCLD